MPEDYSDLDPDVVVPYGVPKRRQDNLRKRKKAAMAPPEDWSYWAEEVDKHAKLGKVRQDEVNAFEAGISIFRDRDGWEYGAKAHRGLLTPLERKWVDLDKVRAMVLEHLGIDKAALALFDKSRPTDAERVIREDIEDKLLELKRRGADMPVIGSALGWPTQKNGWNQKMARVLSRAKKRRFSQAS